MGAAESTEIDISDQDLQEIPLRNRSSLSRITKLYARRNRISRIPSETAFMFQLSELSLRDNALRDIPKILCKLKNLTKLSLSYNQIQTIPADIKNLDKLILLSLAGNQIYSVPNEIGQLESLQALDLQKNSLIHLPDSLCKLKRLETLLVQKNKLLSIPNGLDKCRNLRVLNVGFNNLTMLPFSISSIPVLEELICSGNKLKMFPPTFFINAKHLVNLDIHTNLFKSIPSDIGKAVALKRLNLAINHLTELPDTIGELEQLEWLNLNDNQLKTLPSTVSSLVNLKKIGLVQNELLYLPNEIAGMKSLTKLDLRRNQITAFPPTIRYLPSLTGLLTEGNPMLSTKGQVETEDCKSSTLKICSLVELCARQLWKTRWQDELHRHRRVNLNSSLIPHSPKDSELGPLPTGAEDQILTKVRNLAIEYEKHHRNVSSYPEIPEFISITDMPTRLQMYIATPSACHFCLNPFCGEAIEYIDQSPLKGIPHQHVPLRYWMCSRECIVKFEGKSGADTRAIEMRNTALRWLSNGRRMTVDVSRGVGPMGWYSFVLHETRSSVPTEDSIIPRGWLLDRIRSPGQSPSPTSPTGSSIQNRIMSGAQERRQLETF